MTLANISQALFSAKWTILFYLVLAGGTIVTCLWLLRTLAHADASRQRRPERSLRQTRRAQDPTPTSRRGPRLRQVYPTNDDRGEGGPYPDIDIIAIHGLDTNSPDTWKWRVPGNRKTGAGTEVNWLANPDMLPTVTGRARIFTCDWPADLLQQSSVPTTLHECAQFLRDSIVEHLKTNARTNARRPVLFIASCLGGIILIKALEIDNQRAEDNTDSPSLTRATRGVVFLATPFRGTAFKNMPGFLLKALSSLQDQRVTALIDYALGATPDLDELTKGFISLTKNHGYDVFMFWEARNTVLLRKFHLAWIVSRWILTAWLVALTLVWLLDSFSPWLLVFFLLWLPVFSYCQPQLLVNKHSATLSDFHSQRLDRPHVMMNKFGHSNCIDECKKDCTESGDFGHVSGKIGEMLRKIREGSPVQQADALIRAKHYTTDRLKIERLSGKVLSMDQCYINLAIVEEPRKNARHAEEGSDAAPRSSPFSITARLNVETPDKNIQVGLPSLFDLREDSNGQKMQPRRVLIRGRAGVGKTTLCKKMVYGFPTHEFRKWNELFDRVLWLPLRRLKEWPEPPRNLEKLFLNIYFDQQDQETGAALAKELWHVVKRGRTLFIFDGLDEIAGHWDSGHYMSEFLKDLLDQPNVVITSRPHVSLPANVQRPDVELETIGFYPDQVKDYVQAAFTDTERDCTDTQKVEEVQSYLQAHQLIQDLVRIPIQLDALCFTWGSFKDKVVPQTMTAIYKAIEESLWKKDVQRLERTVDGKPVRMDGIGNEEMDQIENLVDGEVFLLEGLAFTGLHNDVINFDLEHRKAISKGFKLNKTIYWDMTVPRLSFLRTSDPSPERHSREYHFLHLTIQEYFAARYFARQWKAKQPLNSLQLSEGKCNEIEPATFLQEHKYDPRYDIFWRFVAGLLDADREALGFFQAIEKEPRDVLGPTHQRLVMHCLSEVERKETTFTELRTKLEKQLEQWLLFECDSTQDCWLAREMECPEQVLVNALKQASEDARLILLRCLESRASVPPSVIDVAVSWLEDCVSDSLCIAILGILRHQHKALPDMVLQGIAARLEHEDRDVREAAIKALQGQTNLTEEMLQGIAARLEDEDWYVRQAAIEALHGQANLTEGVLQAIAARLGHEDRDVREAAIKALQGEANLTEEMVRAIAAWLEDDDRDVRQAAIKALQGQTNLIEGVLQAVAARLKDDNGDVREAAIKALQGWADLTEGVLQAVATQLEYEDWYVRRAAVKALQGRVNLTEGVLQAIAARLEHEDRYVRRAAVEALQDQTNLTGEMVQAIAARLEDDDEDVREAAIKALQGGANLTEEMVQAIGAWLEDDNGSVRWAATKALQGQTNLTEGVLQAIATQLEDEDWYVRWAAVEALQGRADLTEGMLQAIAVQLEDDNEYVRGAAVKALQGQADLTGEIVQAIAARLEDEDRNVREAATKALHGQTNLTEGMLQAIAARLEDEDRYVREAAVEVLQGEADLTGEIVQAIAARLEHDDGVVRRAAVEALQSRADLTEGILQAIAARLEDEHWYVRRAAIETLVDQASLSLEVLSPYVKPLYTALLQRSFQEHLYLCASDRVFIGFGLRHVSLSCKQEQQPSAEMWEIRNYLDVPPPTS